jgi:hypothetical protein
VTTPGDGEPRGEVRTLVDEGLAEMRFTIESTEAVADWVTDAVEAAVAVIVNARLDASWPQVTVGSAAVADESNEP